MEIQHSGVKSKNLSNEERNAILQTLLVRSNNNKLPKGTIKDVAGEFKVSSKTISRIWARAGQCTSQGMKFANVNSRIKGNSGRKKLCRQELKNKISTLSKCDRMNLRTINKKTAISLGTLCNLTKEKVIKRHSNSLRPMLTPQNKKERLEFALSYIDQTTNYFKSMENVVHVDEKWFYLSRDKMNFYLLPEEDVPHRQVQSKRFITKVMFLAALAKPRWDYHRKTSFDGKLGLWPIVEYEPAKRNSKNRPKGTIVPNPIEINREIYTKLIIEKVIPAIKTKWPRSQKSMEIKIQQDNARPHAKVDDPEIIRAGHTDGWNIDLICQPPNSPDFNVLDLGYFNSIQSIQYQSSPKNIDDLIAVVQRAWEDHAVEKVENIFLTLQKALESSMLTRGGNNYQLAHIGKEALRRKNQLPETLTCNLEAIETARNVLRDI